MGDQELNSMDTPKSKALYKQCLYLAEMFPEDTEVKDDIICLYEECDEKDIVHKMIKAGRDLDDQIAFELTDTNKAFKTRLVYNPFDSELQQRIDLFELSHLT